MSNQPSDAPGQRAEPLPELYREGFYQAIAGRRDMREFLPDPIPQDVLARILMAAHQAGSVGFMQPWNFIVVQDPHTRQTIRQHVEAERVAAAEGFEEPRREKYLSLKLEGIVEAPLNICVTCDPSRFGPEVIGRHTIRETDVYSTCAAVQNLWLAARAEGIGVGWVSILQPEFLRAVLKIPDAIVPVAYLCVGYVRAFPQRPQLETAGWLPRVPLEQLVFGEQFGQAAPPELQEALHGQETRPLSPAQAAGKRPKGRGLVVLYTGEGKGKTTAALGLMARCLGRGYPVGVVQFIKGKWKTGERLFAESHPHLTFHVMGLGFTWESADLEQDRRAAAAAWQQSKEMIQSGDHFVVILDEITYAINYGFIELRDVLETLKNRPAGLHVVLTGRDAPPELIEAADMASEMRKIKHPFDQGIRAQMGIDF